MNKKANKNNQLAITFDSETLQPIQLPDTTFDLVEQLAFALQNRDAIGLRQIIDPYDHNDNWGGRESFINKFVNYCARMDKKHGGVYVQTVPGQCCRQGCNLGTRGLGVSVSTIKQNKLIWRFNLVTRETKRETLALWLCREFSVNHEDIAF